MDPAFDVGLGPGDVQGPWLKGIFQTLLPVLGRDEQIVKKPLLARLAENLLQLFLRRSFLHWRAIPALKAEPHLARFQLVDQCRDVRQASGARGLLTIFQRPIHFSVVELCLCLLVAALGAFKVVLPLDCRVL